MKNVQGSRNKNCRSFKNCRWFAKKVYFCKCIS